MEANHDHTEITCVSSSTTGVDMQCNKPFKLKQILRFENDEVNENLIAKLDNNGTHLTLNYGESDGKVASKGYDNLTLELDGVDYCVRHFSHP